MNTPPKSNMEPENEGLEDDCPFQTGDFRFQLFIFQGAFQVWNPMKM